ncbi:MAG: RNA polymerase sigma factor [Myxococcota bacterium]
MSELDVGALYDEHVDFVFRTLSRLGVDASSLDDAVQQVFLTLHRRRAEFRFASSVRTWIGGISIRVAREHRRSHARHDARLSRAPSAPELRSPDDQLADAQALRLLLRMLDTLDDEQRTVFVLTELEEMTAPEIAEMTGVSVNTVGSRLRLARKHINALVVAHQRAEEAV